MNRTIDMGNGITAVINRTSEYKKTLLAGQDFFYVDTVKLAEMFEEEGYWADTRRSDTRTIARRNHKRKEIRLSRFLTGVLNDRSLIVIFANGYYYDLRMKNLLVEPTGSKKEWIEEKRAVILSELEELPKEIQNTLVEQNPHSIPQETGTANFLKINRLVTLELNITDGVSLQYSPSTLEEEQKAAEVMAFLRDKFTVVQR